MAFADWEFTKDPYSDYWTGQVDGVLTLYRTNTGSASTFVFTDGSAYPRGFNKGVLRTLVRVNSYTISNEVGDPLYWLFCGVHALTETYPLAGMCFGMRFYHPVRGIPEFVLVEVSYSSQVPQFATRLARPITEVFPDGIALGTWVALEFWFWTDVEQLRAYIFKCRASLQTNFSAMTTVFETYIDHDLPTQPFESQGEGFFAHLYSAYPSSASISFDKTSLASLS